VRGVEFIACQDPDVLRAYVLERVREPAQRVLVLTTAEGNVEGRDRERLAGVEGVEYTPIRPVGMFARYDFLIGDRHSDAALATGDYDRLVVLDSPEIVWRDGLRTVKDRELARRVVEGFAAQHGVTVTVAYTGNGAEDVQMHVEHRATQEIGNGVTETTTELAVVGRDGRTSQEVLIERERKGQLLSVLLCSREAWERGEVIRAPEPEPAPEPDVTLDSEIALPLPEPTNGTVTAENIAAFVLDQGEATAGEIIGQFGSSGSTYRAMRTASERGLILKVRRGVYAPGKEDG
jgi:hypothetical protein